LWKPPLNAAAATLPLGERLRSPLGIFWIVLISSWLVQGGVAIAHYREPLLGTHLFGLSRIIQLGSLGLWLLSLARGAYVGYRAFRGPG
jgi:hypothetical protein